MLTTIVTIAGLFQQPAPLTVGPVTARAGEMRSGFLEVAAGVDSATRIPITIVRGRQPGPTLALVAGTHGSEVAPVIALQRLRAQLDPAELKGTVLLVHVANMPSYLGRTIYYSPLDRKNLNRVYPGKADGTVSQRIAAVITREIIERADYLVDIHSGDGNESLRPYTYWSQLGVSPRVDSVAREMALAWGNDHIVIDNERPLDPQASVYTQNTAHLRGTLRLLRYLRMLPGTVELVDHPVWLDKTEVLRSPGTGIWYPLVERGQTVQKGTILGRLTDFFGETLAEIRAPFAGEVLYIVGTPAMSQGEPLGMVGRPVAEP